MQRSATSSTATVNASTSPTWKRSGATPRASSGVVAVRRGSRRGSAAAARCRRAGLGRTHSRRARRVPLARGPAEHHVRGGTVVLAALPVRHRTTRRHHHRARAPTVIRSSCAMVCPTSHEPPTIRSLRSTSPSPHRRWPRPTSRSVPDDMGRCADLVSGQAYAAGLGIAVTTDLVLAVHEIATNSLRHGGGGGRVRVWRGDDELVCEICDAGHISDPLAGRRQPTADATNGRGLWIANRLADLVQVRSTVRRNDRARARCRVVAEPRALRRRRRRGIRCCRSRNRARCCGVR